MNLSEALPTTALILCRSLHAKALQATPSEGLAQGPYVVARMGFETATFPTEDTKPYHRATKPTRNSSNSLALSDRLPLPLILVF